MMCAPLLDSDGNAMGVLQIDTISVVARSPYLVLWSRLGDYDPEWLDQLLAEGALFEIDRQIRAWMYPTADSLAETLETGRQVHAAGDETAEEDK